MNTLFWWCHLYEHREQLDAFRSDTPEEARNAQSPVCLPLDELHRLQDKLQRHSRAEEVAFKRIRDLEMQLKGVKRNEEVTRSVMIMFFKVRNTALENLKFMQSTV
jgi:hypothetical protein